MEAASTGTRRLGRYHLGEPVGGGPTGEVFRARVHGVAGFERQFALKRFHSQLIEQDAARATLRNAARLYAGLEHPRIARLHEHNFETPTPYVAIEWVGGLDLSSLGAATFGQGKPLPAGAATSLLSRAGRAVGYAHGRGHCHLGLAPTNLICTAAGDIKVTDFGFLPARLGGAPADDPTLTARIPYLAPEQLRGEPGTPATDVFVLGALFFELLTGNKAFTGRTGRDIAQVILAAKPPTDAVPKPLGRVLDRCFAASPLERYPSGGALADAIDAASRGMLMRGDQRDVAKSVQQAQERLENLRKEQVSGVLSFPIPAPPSAPLGAPGSSAALASQRSLGVPNLELDEEVNEEQTTDVLPVETLLPPPVAATIPNVAPQPPPVAKPPPLPAAVLEEAAETVPFERGSSPSLENMVTSPQLDSGVTPLQLPTEPPPVTTTALVQPERPPSNFGAGLVDRGPGLPRKVLVALMLAALAAIGFFGALLILGGDDDKKKSSQAIDAGVIAAAPVDAKPVGVTKVLDAAAETPIDAAPTGPSELSITSVPKRATVYFDGAKIGKTPVTVETARDQHKLVLIRPGHKIHIADIKGGGELNVTLDEVTPSGGPAGIKVRCRKKNRYYVWVDGKHTGQLCPTERIEVDLGKHVVEIYDPVTDSRREFEVDVKQTRLSHRIRVD